MSIDALPGHDGDACCGACAYAGRIERGEVPAPARDPRALVFPLDGAGAPRGAAVRWGDKLIPVSKRVVTMGRARDRDVVVPSGSVSRHVGVIRFDVDGVEVEDEHSACGLYVEGIKVQRARLRVGDRLMIGNEIIQVVSV